MAVDREKVQEAARKFAEKKRFDKAIIEYQRIIQEDPHDARILLKIGELQTKMDAFQAAIETYERVGKIYVQQGFARKAIAVYLQIRDLIAKHVPQLEERYAHVLPRLAELYEQCGLISDALPAYDEIASKLLKAGKDQDAIVAFRKLVELDPGNPLGHLRLAEALAKVKDMAGSGQQFLVASDLLVRLGRRDDAIKVLERALSFRPEPTVAKRAARMFLERAQADDGMRALSKLQICFQANPKEIETLALLAHAFEMIGQRPKAIEVKKEIARISKDTGDESLFRGMVQELIREAPDDEVVQQLYQLAQSVPPPAPAPAPATRTGAHPAANQQRAHHHHEEEEAEVSIEEIDEEYLEADYDEAALSQMPMSDGVMIPSSLEVAEELGEQGSFDPVQFTIDTVAESLAYRQANLHAKALETLRIGLEVLPASIELREQLRDTLLEVGDREGAVGEMITLAAIAIDALDVERASAMLHDVLHLQPGHMRAREMLYDLGFTDIDDEPAQPEQAVPIASSNFQTYDSRRPLPSYDLEEVGPGRGFATTGGMESRARDLLEADDPFDTRVPLSSPNASIPPHGALPSFALEEDDPFEGVPVRPEIEIDSQPIIEPDFGDDLPPPPASGRTFVGVAPPPNTSHDTDAAPPRMSVAPAGPLVSGTAFQGGESIEDALEEVDFFASRGMIDDARSVIQEQLDRLPNHPLLLDKMRELDELEQEQSAAAPPPKPPSHHPHASDDVDDILDLDGLDSFEPTQEAAPQMSQGEQVDVEAVFEMFKAGVKEQISENDSATHYDLGLSYLPMGRLDDAIQMFLISARDPKRECVSLAMIGMTEVQRGNLDAAIEAFRKALVAPARTVTEETSIYYELGDIFEKKKYRIEALESFQKAARREPDFRDVQERIKKLEPPKSVRPKIASADDDFDSMLDDLFDK